MFKTLSDDIQAVLERDPAARSKVEVLLCYPGLHAVLIHRGAHALWRRGWLLSARLLSQFGRWLTGIEIHPGARLGRRLLIDTPPELRLQLVAAGVDRVDAVLFTHAHADHVHGIDDLRALTVKAPGPLPAFGPAATIAELAAKFPYIFDPTRLPPPGSRVRSRPRSRK